MLLVAWFLVGVLTVPLLGGRLARAIDFRPSGSHLLLVALALQVLVISVFPQGDTWLHALVHVASYGFIAAFLWVNRAVSGLWVVGVGTGANLLAISLNGGTMPASAAAVEAAGLSAELGSFSNSAAVVDPKLGFLGDVFAWPEPLPLANVFSIGDVSIVVGAILVLHHVCGSPAREHRAETSPA